MRGKCYFCACSRAQSGYLRISSCCSCRIVRYGIRVPVELKHRPVLATAEKRSLHRDFIAFRQHQDAFDGINLFTEKAGGDDRDGTFGEIPHGVRVLADPYVRSIGGGKENAKLGSHIVPCACFSAGLPGGVSRLLFRHDNRLSKSGPHGPRHAVTRRASRSESLTAEVSRIRQCGSDAAVTQETEETSICYVGIPP